MTPIRDPKDMSREELALFATRLQAILYLDSDVTGKYWNPDKEWSPTTLDEIGELMNHTDLRPDYIEEVEA